MLGVTKWESSYNWQYLIRYKIDRRWSVNCLSCYRYTVTERFTGQTGRPLWRIEISCWRLACKNGNNAGKLYIMCMCMTNYMYVCNNSTDTVGQTLQNFHLQMRRGHYIYYETFLTESMFPKIQKRTWNLLRISYS